LSEQIGLLKASVPTTVTATTTTTVSAIAQPTPAPSPAEQVVDLKKEFEDVLSKFVTQNELVRSLFIFAHNNKIK